MKPTISGTKSATQKPVPSPYIRYQTRSERERAFLQSQKKNQSI